ncbi:bifunctional adenosylcobinamide kinase/adenosylcobinamide-phosphate guanylyltransferase [Aureimonas sp. N4]|uniref:bifunctional adenosylcobinamide kinase/adenosylcobinamide-phosphate guanylyltransferase n=1 Tax=Aureimonas sp. N4 TaxID=1638165 RepID=UPI0007849F19|nr:bifunctional adenosylcobinamide kinase/adenosylcobinamide-phosphate guanylyltransferase [Aureimonas sp. N4]
MTVHFILGGARSGKSRLAEGLVLATGFAPVYIATGQAFDAEMEARIAEHQARRPSPWVTVDAPLDLAEAIAREAGEGRALLVDCLTLWLTNLMMAEADIEAEARRLCDVLRQPQPGFVALVSNEVGLSIVPENALARRFRDEAGRLHQQIAALASKVTFVAAGLPLQLKG